MPKVLRIFIPFLIAYVIELPLLIIDRKENAIDILKCFFRGGYGPGNYYILIMIQMIWLGPLIYLIILKHDFFGTIICFIFTALWEIIAFSLDINGHAYGYSVLRYMSIYAFGCFIAIGRTQLSNKFLILIFMVGLGWQISLNYIPLHPYFMNYDWARVNYISSLFIMPCMYWLIKKVADKKIKLPILKSLGRASFNIYLVQMILYGSEFSFSKIIPNFWVGYFVTLLVCLVLGYAFYLLENLVTQRVIWSLENKDYYKNFFSNIVIKCNQFVSK